MNRRDGVFIPPRIELSHFTQLGESVSANTRKEEDKSVWGKLVNALSYRYPIVSDWIRNNQNPTIPIPSNNPHLGDWEKVTKNTIHSIVDIINLGHSFKENSPSPANELNEIRDKTVAAENSISHYLVLEAILEVSNSIHNEDQLRQVLAKTLQQSHSMFKEGMAHNPNYSPIEQAKRLAEYLQNNKTNANPIDLQNIIARRMSYERAYRKHPDQKNLDAAKLITSIESGTYVDAAKALLYFPNSVELTSTG